MSRKTRKTRSKFLSWTTYLVVGLMLATMLMYLASQDEAEPEAIVDTIGQSGAPEESE